MKSTLSAHAVSTRKFAGKRKQIHLSEFHDDKVHVGNSILPKSLYDWDKVRAAKMFCVDCPAYSEVTTECIKKRLPGEGCQELGGGIIGNCVPDSERPMTLEQVWARKYKRRGE